MKMCCRIVSAVIFKSFELRRLLLINVTKIYLNIEQKKEMKIPFVLKMYVRYIYYECNKL